MLDDIIRRLTGAKVGRTTKQVQLTEAEIRQLCVSSKEIFLSQPNLLELEAPIKICGKFFFFFFIVVFYFWFGLKCLTACLYLFELEHGLCEHNSVCLRVFIIIKESN